MNWFYENHLQETYAGYQTRTATAWGYSDDDIADGVAEGMQSGDLLDGWPVPEPLRKHLAEHGGMVEWAEVLNTETWEGYEEVRICEWDGEEFVENMRIRVDVQR